MSLFHSDNVKEKDHKGILGAFSVDVIKWEPEFGKEADVIVHRYEYEDFPNGSYLIVGPSQMAIFTNNLTEESSLDGAGDGKTQVSTFIGPCKIKLETGDSRFAPFRNIAHGLTDGQSAFHSTVYFMNTTYMNELSWGTRAPIVVEDPDERINVHVRAQGFFGAHIEKEDTSLASIHARRVLEKVVGTKANYTQDDLTDFMRAKILERVPDLLSKAIVNDQIGVLRISAYLSEFSKNIYEQLVEHFVQFGLTLDNFSFTNINVPDEDLARLNEAKIYKETKIKESQGNAAGMDIESAALARKRAREGYTYQQEHSFNVMENAASNEGSGSDFLGAGMGLGMGFGAAGAMRTGMKDVIDQGFSTKQEVQGGNNVCTSCGTLNPENAKFCLHCGKKIEQQEVCPSCGQPIMKNAMFCMHCGTKLKKDVAICPDCKTELPEGSKFCPICGKEM